MSRRHFLRGAALAGGGVVAATVAACAPSVPTPRWTYGPTPAPSQPAAATSPGPVPTASMGPSPPAPSPAASGSPGATIPPGWSEHDVSARSVVRRYLGNLVPALEGIYGPAAFAKLGQIQPRGALRPGALDQPADPAEPVADRAPPTPAGRDRRRGDVCRRHIHRSSDLSDRGRVRQRGGPSSIRQLPAARGARHLAARRLRND